MSRQLIIQSNSVSCLAAATAMACECQERDVFDYCGHDGREVIFPKEPSPYKYRGFHLNEIMSFAGSRGIALVRFENNPCFYDEIDKPYFVDTGVKVLELMLKLSGILLGEHNGKPHAVFWDTESGLIYDPVGVRYPPDEFDIDEFLVPVLISSHLPGRT